MSGTTIAFDLGGTKIDICRMTGDGTLVFRERVATDSLCPGNPEFLGKVFDLFGKYVLPQDTKIGLSWNAPVHQQRLTQSSLLGGPITVDLGGMLRERFAHREIQVESDVHAMALGEFKFGVGKTQAPFVLINLGSGAGFAYHDGCDVMRGYLGGAGLVCQEERWVEELQCNLSMDYLLAGRGVALLHERLGGSAMPAAQVAGRADHDAIAAKVFDIIGHHFGHYLVTLGRMFNPRAFVLAGSVAKAADLFLPKATQIALDRLEPACRPDLITVSTVEALACRGFI